MAAAENHESRRNAMKSRFSKSVSLFFVFAVLSVLGAARAATSEVATDETRQIARDAYVYAYSPVYAYRFLQDEVFNEKSISYIGAFNRIRSYRRLNTPDDTMFAPNVDTPYTRVWLDLRAEPVVLTLPKITPENRYYVMQATSLDHYNLDFSGTRTIGQDGGSIIYVGPRYSGPIPNGVGRVVISPTDFVYLQGRILVFNPDDMKNVAALQDGITLKTLSETLGQPKAKTAEKFQLKPWTNDDEVLRSVKTLDYLAYLLPFISLHAPEEQQLLRRFARIGIVPGVSFSLEGRSADEKSAIEAGVMQGVDDVNAAIAGATSSRGLFGSKEELSFNYLSRAAGVGAGIFGNSPAEAMYVGATLNKAKAGDQYVLTFPAGQLPPIEKGGFWSATMYNLPQRQLIHNSIERYSIGDRSPGLVHGADGSLTIYLQPNSPGKDKEANWLPTPPEGPFFYVIRLYLPAAPVQDGTWQAPNPVLAP
jgi:hypothetical protein